MPRTPNGGHFVSSPQELEQIVRDFMTPSPGAHIVDSGFGFYPAIEAVPPPEVFTVWLKGLQVLKHSPEVNGFMADLAKVQPRLTEVGIHKPYLPNRTSDMLEEQEIYAALPQFAGILDMVEGTSVAAMLGHEQRYDLEGRPLLNPERVAQAQDAGLEVFISPGERDGSDRYVLMDLGNFYAGH
jgi:hypothetical protein